MNKKTIACILVSVLSIVSLSGIVYVKSQSKATTEIIVPGVVKNPNSFEDFEDEYTEQGQTGTTPILSSFLTLSPEELLDNLLYYALELPPDYANHPEELAEPFLFDYFHQIISEEWTEEVVNNWVLTVDSEESQMMMLNLYGEMQRLGFVPVS